MIFRSLYVFMGLFALAAAGLADAELSKPASALQARLLHSKTDLASIEALEHWLCDPALPPSERISRFMEIGDILPYRWENNEVSRQT